MLLDRLTKDLHTSVHPFAVCEVAAGSRLHRIVVSFADRRANARLDW